MTLNSLLSYMSQYGLWILALVVFLEYFNVPGFPAGVIMPVTGVWVARSDTPFIWALIISILAALAASWLMYAVGWYFGDIILRKCKKKWPKKKAVIEKQMTYLKEKGWVWVLISKVIPVARTIVPIPAGMIRVEFWGYTIASAIGITIWNTALIASGYFFGEQVISRLF